MIVTGGTHALVATLFLFLLTENVNSKAPKTGPKVGMAPDLEFHPKIIKPKIAKFEPETLQYEEGKRDTGGDEAEEAAVPLGTKAIIDGREYFKSKHGCSHWGTRPSAAECQGMGNGGKDKANACESGSGNMGCNECTKYDNVGKQFCPVMCGLCDDTGDSVGLSNVEEFSKREMDEELVRIARDAQRYHMRKRYPDAEEGENEIRHYQRDAAATCTTEFSSIAGHTMCMTDREDVTDSGLKEGDAEIIVDEHNRYRGTVVPSATDLQRLVWNDRLAEVAEKWAKQCVLAHDKVRNLPEFPNFVGQNVAVGYNNWEESMKAWYNEIELWHYGVDPDTYLKEGEMVGHFTQMVTNTTTLVGCGYAVCTNSEYKRYYVCNYMIGQSSKAYPYTTGDRCNACPGTCAEGLCDCKGKTCNGRGRLILDGCKCECNFPFLGEDCSGVICPPEESPRCATEYTDQDCETYNNMAVICPYKCGFCTDKDKQIFDNVPPGTGIKVGSFDYFHSEHGCSFFGDRPSTDKCMTYGTYGNDVPSACASHGGKYDCDACKRYSNVATQFCPVMCGFCDGVDPAVIAAVEKGTGTLIHGQKYFKSIHGCDFWGDRPTTDECQALESKGVDKSYACATGTGKFGCQECIKYSNIGPVYCPVMCGLCDG